MLEKYIKEDLIFLDVKSKNRQELFDEVSKHLYENGYVTEDYGKNLNERENNFPTAIKLGKYSFAIPHTDVEYTIKPFISVITMDSTVSMNRMDDQDEETDVDVLFVLGFNDSSSHLEVLRTLIRKIQNIEVIKNMKNIKEEKELGKYIIETFKEDQ